ncbi:MAG: LamG domain-containing protein [Planctomycetota bacterium]|jgi:hypothetical protein
MDTKINPRTGLVMVVFGMVVVCVFCSAAAGDPNLVGWWRFDEGTGVTAYDSAGDNYGTIHRATWTTGVIGGALDFDGSGDYVVISNEENFDFGSDTDFTICVWIKTTATFDRRRIVNKSRSGHAPYTGIEFYMDPPGIVHFRPKDNADKATVMTTTSVNDGFWHFLVGVADRDGDLRIYHNGILEDTASLALVDDINNNVPLAIGRSMDYNGQYFDGTIDDVRIYNRALSAGEIQQLYEDGLGDMVAHWTFDEGSGTIAHDSAGNNHGTLVNDPTWSVGQIDGGLGFDGSNDYVVVADDSSLDIAGAISFSAWIKLHGDLDWQIIISKRGPGGGYPYGGYTFHFQDRYWNTGGAYRLLFTKTNGIAGSGGGNYGTHKHWDRVASNKDDWQTDVWYHVAATWDGTTNTNSMKMYIDGQLDATHTAKQAFILTNDYALTIGDILPQLTDPFNGVIDDVRIYKRALSAAEVQALYQGGLVNTAPVACIVGGDRAVEADSNCEVVVMLDGSCSSDADSTEGTNDDINDFDWYDVIDVCEPNSDIYIGSGEVIECNLGLGEHLIVLEVTDRAGAFDSNEVVITVEDVTPPELSVVVEPNILWPPNGKMVLVRPEWEVSDNCDEEVEVSLVDISMNVEEDTNDYVHIGDDGSIYLRARKSKRGSGRIYTLTYEAVDDSGNVTEKSTTVAVRHRKGPRRPDRELVRRPGRRIYRRKPQRR